MLLNDLLNKNVKLSLIGLGYVGLPIAIAFAKKLEVIGYDINKEKIRMYKKGHDPTGEVGDEVLSQSTLKFTSNEEDLRLAKFHIIAVPTPVKKDYTPDLNPIISSSKIVGRNLTKGSIVVYESTVYPGLTEEICIPLLERESGLKCGEDFKVGYSPERINPGDKNHRLESIIKVVSAIDDESLDIIAEVYKLVVEVGVFKADSIKVAEAAKVIENSQRDINIAFMNELSIIFNKLGIDTQSVLDAASTKWNFLKFTPGLVGGHCIGVDPYYLTFKAEQIGYHSQVILSGRRINDGMGKYVVENLIKILIEADISVKNSKIAIFGLTFKENCPDTRNTRVIDIINELKTYGIKPLVIDPLADRIETQKEYGINLTRFDELVNLDAIIVAVAHNQFKSLSINDFNELYNPKTHQNKVFIDIKGIYNKDSFRLDGYSYWRL